MEPTVKLFVIPAKRAPAGPHLAPHELTGKA